MFIVKNSALLTPPASDGALDGITRRVVIELAARVDIVCREETLTPYDLYTADKCFLTGTGAELIPVREIDGRLLETVPGKCIYRHTTTISCIDSTGNAGNCGHCQSMMARSRR